MGSPVEREWQRAKAQETQWPTVELKINQALLEFSAGMEAISDHDQAQLRARAVEMMRQLRNFVEETRKAKAQVKK